MRTHDKRTLVRDTYPCWIIEPRGIAKAICEAFLARGSSNSGDLPNAVLVPVEHPDALVVCVSDEYSLASGGYCNTPRMVEQCF